MSEQLGDEAGGQSLFWRHGVGDPELQAQQSEPLPVPRGLVSLAVLLLANVPIISTPCSLKDKDNGCEATCRNNRILLAHLGEQVVKGQMIRAPPGFPPPQSPPHL